MNIPEGAGRWLGCSGRLDRAHPYASPMMTKARTRAN